MENVDYATSGWSRLALVISHLLEHNPLQGLLIIGVTMVVFAAISFLLVWGLVKVIRARSSKDQIFFSKEAYMSNVLESVRELGQFLAERYELTRTHTKMQEHSLVRDQMIAVEATLEQIKNRLMISFADRVRKDHKEFKLDPQSFPDYKIFDHTLNMAMSSWIKEMRRSSKDNHLAEKSEKEFSDYSTEKLCQLQLISELEFDRSYVSTQTPVDVIKEVFLEQWTENERRLKDLLLTMRSISIKYQDYIRREDRDFNQRWSTFLASFPEKLLQGTEK